MRPSFFSLFKRGKYFRPPVQGPAGGSIQRTRGNRNEAERFAAAAIAFAWQYHRPLRQHFFETVCRFPGDPGLSRDAEIFVEPERWADLLVVNRGLVYAIECKIGADLDKCQNPEQRAFAEVGGYGHFLTTSQVGAGKERRYIVFGFPAELDFPECPWKLRLKVQQRSWDNFSAGFPKAPFARDLALSLGKFGIGAFPASETKTMKVNAQRSDIGSGVKTLAEVQRRLDWPAGRSCQAHFYREQTAWYLGLELKSVAKMANSVALTKLAKPPGRALAWIGYQGEDDSRAQLALYVYCKNAVTQKSLAAKLGQKLKRFQVDSPEPDKRDFCVIVTARRHCEPNDVEWFCSVLKALDLSIKP